jgi:hypothetical protein
MKRPMLVLIAALALLVVSPPAAAQWPSYAGPNATFYNYWWGNYYYEVSGWNYWTSNRVYRPIGHPFHLTWCGLDYQCHTSVTNSGTNPFYHNAYGYNSVMCTWNYWEDWALDVYPVTCQSNV